MKGKVGIRLTNPEDCEQNPNCRSKNTRREAKILGGMKHGVKIKPFNT